MSNNDNRIKNNGNSPSDSKTEVKTSPITGTISFSTLGVANNKSVIPIPTHTATEKKYQLINETSSDDKMQHLLKNLPNEKLPTESNQFRRTLSRQSERTNINAEAAKASQFTDNSVKVEASLEIEKNKEQDSINVAQKQNLQSPAISHFRRPSFKVEGFNRSAPIEQNNDRVQKVDNKNKDTKSSDFKNKPRQLTPIRPAAKPNKSFANKNYKNDPKLDAKKKSPGDFAKKSSNRSNSSDRYNIKTIMKDTFVDFDNINNNEIDEVLGNVINVKAASVNKLYPLEKERRLRTSSLGMSMKKDNDFITREVEIFNNKISVSELADKMAIRSGVLIKDLMKIGLMVTANSIIDGDEAQIVAESYGHIVKRRKDSDIEDNFLQSLEDRGQNLQDRAPIVTIMGHVDHGKTSLLDTIRKTSVVSQEAGGITQAIGAYKSKVGDKFITFIDTPGHAAFTQMRARGAQVTDIVVIVVAADDGIMPQTIEAINHAKAASVPIIVAINKIDKPDADIQKTQQMLFSYDLVPEEFGGDTIVIPISAKKGTNVDKLLDAILLLAQMLELKSYIDTPATGFVIESRIDKNKGPMATVIVQNGFLKTGDIIVAGCAHGKVRLMLDENALKLKEAGPSCPVAILGFDKAPNAGDIFHCANSEEEVRDLIAYRKEKSEMEIRSSKVGKTLEGFFSKSDEKKKVSLIIKADTKGSLEAILASLSSIKHKDVSVSILHSGVGYVTESDLNLAKVSNAIILGFNSIYSSSSLEEYAKSNNITVNNYSIIYELLDAVKLIMTGKLEPIMEEKLVGSAEVKAIFDLGKSGKVIGCYVQMGVITRGYQIKILRSNKEFVAQTKIISIRKQKDDVKEVSNSHECGIAIDKSIDVKIGDILECYQITEKKRHID